MIDSESLPTSPLQKKLDVVELSHREFESLPLILRGYYVSELQVKFGVSKSTTKKRLHNIYRKFSVNNRQELILLAIKEGLQYRLTGSSDTNIYFLEVNIHMVNK